MILNLLRVSNPKTKHPIGESRWDMSGMKIQKKKEYKTSPFISKTNFKLLTRRKTWRLCRDKLHPIKFQRQRHLKNPTFVPWFVYIPLFYHFFSFCFYPKNSARVFKSTKPQTFVNFVGARCLIYHFVVLLMIKIGFQIKEQKK